MSTYTDWSGREQEHGDWDEVTLDQQREMFAIAALERTGLTHSDAQAAYDAGERAVIVENARDQDTARQRVGVMFGWHEIVSIRKIRSHNGSRYQKRGADFEIIYRIEADR